MPGRSWTQRLRATLKRWWVAYITWRIERAALAQLWSLSDRYLKDIGLTRSEILRAVKGETAAKRRLPGSLRSQSVKHLLPRVICVTNNLRFPAFSHGRTIV
jgi:uncharacterized protein YjiS (DUF1127 family)